MHINEIYIFHLIFIGDGDEVEHEGKVEEVFQGIITHLVPTALPLATRFLVTNIGCMIYMF